MSAHDTPRAFPSNANDDEYGGMTLRDYFAGHAFQSIMLAAGLQAVLKGEEFRPAVIAQDAYKFADCMLAARSRGASNG